MTAQLETEHFKIVHAHWNRGTLYPEWSIQAKPNTSDSRALVPDLAKSYVSAESLVPALLEAEEWYSHNRASLEGRAA